MRIKIYSALLTCSLFFVSFGIVAADHPLVELKKTYTKSYSINGNERVSFANKFGSLKINTWDKNEIKVEVVISVSDGNDARAHKTIDGISIEDGKSNAGVYFKTVIANGASASTTVVNLSNVMSKGTVMTITSSGKQVVHGMSIDFVVYMPDSNPLYIDMQFGSTVIPDYKGAVEIYQSYGELTTGKLSDIKYISSLFGTATINGINNGKLKFEYGNAEVNSISGAVEVESGFGQLRLGVEKNIRDLIVNNKYGELSLQLADNIDARFNIRTNYSTLINNMSGIRFFREGRNNDFIDFRRTYKANSYSGNSSINIISDFGNVKVGR